MQRTVVHLWGVLFGLMCLSGGVVLGVWGLTGGEPWLGSLLGSGNSMYDVIGGIALLALGVACVLAWRRAVTERIEETEVDVEAVLARIREFD